MFAIQINYRLKDIKGCKDDFEGVSIIAIGDYFPLEPVMDSYVFRDLNNLYYAFVAPNLWQQHFTMFEVNEIMGQRESKFFIELLNRLQEGKHTPSDTATLKERIIQDNINNPIDAPHLFIQNAKVDEFNERVHNAEIGIKHRIKVQENITEANTAGLRGKILQQYLIIQGKLNSWLGTNYLAEGKLNYFCTLCPSPP